MRSDFRIAARRLRLAVAALATLALGAGAATLIFTAADGALPRQMPYADDAFRFALWSPATPTAAGDRVVPVSDLDTSSAESGDRAAHGALRFARSDLADSASCRLSLRRAAALGSAAALRAE